MLVVDDMADNRELFAMVLEGQGYKVECAVDGVDGVERARQLRPNVVLMDLAMPQMDGFEAAEALRSIPELAGVPVIAITAFTDAATIARALACGCVEVLAKPCHPDLLAERVAASLNTATARAVG